MAFTSDWFSENIPVWTKILRKYNGKNNLSFLEIGCFEGRATKWLLDNILTGQNSKITVVDTFDGGPDLRDWNINSDKLLKTFRKNVAEYLLVDKSKSKVLIKKGNSAIILREMLPQEIFDFIYIDGSHIAKDVLLDSILSWGLLKVGGIMIFDDYRWEEHFDPTLNPKLAIESFLGVYRGWYKILHVGYQLILQKKGNKSYSDKATNTILNNLFVNDRVMNKLKNMEIKLSEQNDQLNVIKDSKFYKLYGVYTRIKQSVVKLK